MRYRSIAASLCLFGCMAASEPAKPSFDMGVGFHTQGVMLTALGLGESFGGFAGYAWLNRNSDGIDPKRVALGEWKGKNAYHAGVAYRVGTVVIGAGIGTSNTNYYRGESKVEAGPVGMVRFNLSEKIGLHLVGGTYGAGASLEMRF